MKMIKVFLLTCVLINFVKPACKCEHKGPIAIEQCSVNYDVCGCVEHVTEWRYKASAQETHSGKAADARWFKSGTGAADQATVNLFNSMTGDTDCNCQQQNQTIGLCHLNIKGCFCFKDSVDIDQKKPQFKTWATDLASKTQSYQCCDYNVTKGIETVVLDVLKKVNYCVKGEDNNENVILIEEN